MVKRKFIVHKEEYCNGIMNDYLVYKLLEGFQFKDNFEVIIEIRKIKNKL
jgi:hypothetical protein